MSQDAAAVRPRLRRPVATRHRLAGLAAACALAAPAWACPPLAEGQWRALDLDQALARVADCHPDVRTAAAALAGALADTRTAAQRPNPQLTLAAGNLGSGGIGAGNLWAKTFDHQLRLDQLVERGGKPALRTAAAQALHQAAQADLAEATRQARLGLARNWIDARAALLRRDELAAAVALNAEAARALARRVKAGDAAPLDATRFALDDARAQADWRQAQADARSFGLQLTLTLGGTVSDADALSLALSVPESKGQVSAESSDSVGAAPPAISAISANADPAASQATESALATVERRPDLVAARARVSAAEFTRDLAHSLATRDVSVGLQFDRYPSSAANPAGTGNTVTLSVSLPLFVRHAYQGEAARAQADLSAAQAAERRLQSAARSDLARAQAQADAAQARLSGVTAQLLPAAERVAAGAELAYQRGASSALDLLDARRSLRAVRVERINAQADAAKAAAEVQAATLPIDALTPR